MSRRGTFDRATQEPGAIWVRAFGRLGSSETALCLDWWVIKRSTSKMRHPSTLTSAATPPAGEPPSPHTRGSIPDRLLRGLYANSPGTGGDFRPFGRHSTARFHAG